MTDRGVQKQIKALVSDGLLKRDYRPGTSPSYTLKPPNDVHPTPERRSPKPLKNPELNPRETRAKKSEVTFSEFEQRCIDNGEDAMPADHAVFRYASRINLSVEFLHLAWLVFYGRFRDSPKRYRDWRATFKNYVERGWLGLWYIDKQTGEYLLTTAGMQAAREHGVGMPREPESALSVGKYER
ncbi:hypothetical protein RM530_05655 [Algiphilus sp. W345]|uniref:Uncharacterized protein n=1 Tax=Banduia mediterranea TaxID=3075609 RepID=A0ABU2WG52_9GAMM|nr:hypothetical protein [Algiphilus sp. W345]MDT0496848.1 hypothetical protein [Algiphilus sp. W345]